VKVSKQITAEIRIMASIARRLTS